MSFTLGKTVKISVFGQSHAEAVGVTIDGLPAGMDIDLSKIQAFLDRRKGGGRSYTTARKEDDIPEILGGIRDGKTCGAPLTAIFRNANVRRKDYEKTANIPRPSHADYTAWVKYGGKADMSGGGHFSARLTLPMCFAGAVCMQLLEKEGIRIGAHIARIGNVTDDPYSPVSEDIEPWAEGAGLPVLNTKAASSMEELMDKTASEGDSVGGEAGDQGLGNPFGLFEINGILAFTEHHRIAVQAPGLSAGPGGFIGVALVGAFHADGSVFRVVIDDVPGGEVLPEVILDGRIRMREGDVPKGIDPAESVCFHQQFEVHHVVDDDREFPTGRLRIDIPAEGCTDGRIETARESMGRIDHGLPPAGVSGDPQRVPVTAVGDETDIMVTGLLRFEIDLPGVFLSECPHPLISRLEIDVPEAAGEETRTPPAGA